MTDTLTDAPAIADNYVDNLWDEAGMLAVISGTERGEYLWQLNWVNRTGHTAEEFLPSVRAALARRFPHDDGVTAPDDWTVTSIPSEPEPVPERTAQAEALATMRRREADAIRDRDVFREERRAAIARAEAAEADITDGSDPRVRGMALAAAREANNRGYCPEYDRIARTVGWPDRDDLSDELNPEVEVNVDIEVRVRTSVTVTVNNNDYESDSGSAVREAIRQLYNDGDDIEESVRGAGITRDDVEVVDWSLS